MTRFVGVGGNRVVRAAWGGSRDLIQPVRLTEPPVEPVPPPPPVAVA